MQLISITMKGFKSFATKTTIEFPKGIISIVGPNGSGKSNVLDALRWVLGEQSAKTLRGNNMDDVIFLGTNQMPAANHCEVEIVIDNSDHSLDINYEQVSISRKSYKNGENIYKLNGKQCRLKDIRELLLDSGIGKEGYSIVAQGNVNEIIYANPKQRRLLFEEASGIAKSRSKKIESEKKLIHVKDNLDRINDVYHQIEDQIKPLEKQYHRARQYNELSEQLKLLEINILYRKYYADQLKQEQLQKQNDQLLQMIQSVTRELHIHKQKVENSDKTMVELEQAKVLLDTEKSTLYRDLQNVETKLTQTAYRKEQLTTELTERHRNEKATLLSLEEDQSILQDKMENLSQIRGSLSQMDNKINNYVTISAQSEQKILSDQAILDEKKDELIALMNQRHKIELTIEQNESNDDKVRTRFYSLCRELMNVRLDYLEARRIAWNQKKRLVIDMQEKSKLEAEQKRTEMSVHQMKLQIDSLDQELLSLDHTMKEAEHNIRIYTSLEDSLSDYNKGVRFVLKNKALDGIHGAVSQLIHVKTGYEKAIEVALGGAMQNVIIESDLDAKKAIEMLKRNKAGKVTFLPLNTMRNYQKTVSPCLKAIDCIEYDPMYEAIMTILLGKILVVDTMEEGIRLSKRNQYRSKVVTTQGEVFHAGGSLSGGAYSKSNNLFLKKRQLAEQKETLEIIQNQKTERKQLRDGLLSQYERIQVEHSKFLARYQTLNDAILQTKQQLELQRKSVEYINLNNIRLESEFDSQNVAIHSNSDVMEAQKDAFVQKKLEIEQTKIQIEETQLRLEDASVKQKNELNELNAMKLEKESTEIKYQFLKEQVQQHEKALRNHQAQLEELSDRIQSIKREQAEQSALWKEFSDQKDELAQNLRTIQEKESDIRESIVQNNKSREEASKRHKEIEAEYLSLSERRIKVQSQVDGRLESLNEIRRKILDDYQIEIENAKTFIRDELDIDHNKVKALKNKIQNLGAINQESITDYPILNEKYLNYKKQKVDLEKSLAELTMLLEKLEARMSREFNIHFKKINEIFKDNFSILFHGGKAELQLTDSSNPLETEIEIIAQPPGKKINNINLLSGGEKTLTAIALLFSMIMIRPTPFCFLDEIDGPLDDLNIHRFCNFLKKLSMNTQFITITHRRGTMESSDYIYGVTMQNKGISKMVSIRLQDADSYIQEKDKDKEIS